MIRDESFPSGAAPAAPAAPAPAAPAELPIKDKWLCVKFIRDMFNNEPFIRHEYSQLIKQLNNILTKFIRINDDIQSITIEKEEEGTPASASSIKEELSSKLLKKLCNVLEKIARAPVLANGAPVAASSNSQLLSDNQKGKLPVQPMRLF
jgi:hypothetical protein